jgi:hypothetical protein
MATQDLIEFVSDEEGEDDDVQAILAVLQTRKEKQQKLKKQIRDRATKSQKQLKDESEQMDPSLSAIAARMKNLEENLQQLNSKFQDFLPIPPGISRQEDEAITQAEKHLVELAKQVITRSDEIEAQFAEKISRITLVIQAERKRCRNEEVIAALDEMCDEVNNAINVLRPTS